MDGQDQDIQKRLEAAELRLAKAVDRLETALDKRSASDAGVESDLASELSRLQTENAELKGLAQQTSVRLDATIVKLKDHMGAQTEGQA